MTLPPGVRTSTAAWPSQVNEVSRPIAMALPPARAAPGTRSDCSFRARLWRLPTGRRARGGYTPPGARGADRPEPRPDQLDRAGRPRRRLLRRRGRSRGCAPRRRAATSPSPPSARPGSGSSPTCRTRRCRRRRAGSSIDAATRRSTAPRRIALRGVQRAGAGLRRSRSRAAVGRVVAGWSRAATGLAVLALGALTWGGDAGRDPAPRRPAGRARARHGWRVRGDDPGPLVPRDAQAARRRRSCRSRGGCCGSWRSR